MVCDCVVVVISIIESIDSSEIKFLVDRTDDRHGHRKLVDGVLEGALALADLVQDLPEDVWT